MGATPDIEVLTTTAWPFAYVDKETELRSTQPLISLTTQPLISLTPAGRITGVRLNDRAIRPLRVPAAQAEAAYAAYDTWQALVTRADFRLTFLLVPGDCLIFDNTRILHARTAFDANVLGGDRVGADRAGEDRTGGDGVGGDGVGGDGAPARGERHLQGCYADLDGLLSTLAVPRRGHGR